MNPMDLIKLRWNFSEIADRFQLVLQTAEEELRLEQDKAKT